MRHSNALLEFDCTRNMSKELELVLGQLLLGEDDLWETGADELSDMIDMKIIEIDMLLSRIKHASDYNNGIVVEIDDEIEKETKNITHKIDTMKKETSIVV